MTWRRRLFVARRRTCSRVLRRKRATYFAVYVTLTLVSPDPPPLTTTVRERLPVDVLRSKVPEDELFDPDRFEWRKGRPLLWMIGGNTFGHYQEHIDWINEWLAKK